jgi:hypothetical protein
MCTTVLLLTVWASAKISSLLAKVYVGVSTVLIFNADEDRVANVGAKAATEPTRNVEARASFIVNKSR